MAVELKIRWDGDAPGLDEHRLSLAAFGEPLAALLSSLRRIATQILRTAVEGEPPETGRFANLARQIDIQITNVEGNSTGVNALVSFQADPAVVMGFADLPVRATDQLLDAIDRETKNQPTSGVVRRYLRLLPKGLTHQMYEVFDGGKLRKRVEVSDVKLVELPVELPMLKEHEGQIIGLGFEPGKSEIRIKTDSNIGATLSAPPDTVERAFEIRHERVRALSVQDEKRSRLIKLQKASEPRFTITPEATEKYIFGKWNELLTRLAK